MRIAIVENTAVTHHGQIGVALHEAGARVRIFRPFDGEGLPLGPGGFDALIVFGGEQSALDDAHSPWLPQLADLIAAFAKADRAVLGVCLGAQLTARAFGARNLIASAPEFGWTDLALTKAGCADPVLGALPPAFTAFQWHSDTFTLPRGAVHLATGAGAALQAFRIGRAVYATQFHFEANRAVVADWCATFPDLIDRTAPGWRATHAELSATEGCRADLHGLTLARAFLTVV